MKATLALAVAVAGLFQVACKKEAATGSDVHAVADNKTLVDAGIAVCTQAPGSAAREKALATINAAAFGTRQMDFQNLGASQETCITQLLPAAIYTSIRSGVPVSSLMAQAAQETGWCTSKLSKTGFNFHGQKAKFAASKFQYWDGAAIDISSSESTTGSGNNVVSSFMKFKHPDFSFYAVAERQTMQGLPYRECARHRLDTTKYIDCFAKSWAVHATYGEHLKKHISTFKFQNTTLATCDLKKSEWRLDQKFSDLPVDL